MTRSGYGKVAAITGGGSGLGRAVAYALAGNGYNVAVSDINDIAAAETVESVRRAGVEGFARHVDVTEPDDVEAWADAIWQRWGRCDVLVNNAGVASLGKTGEVDLADWRWCIDIDLFGVIHGCHVFAPRMARQGSGHIVNVASIAAYALTANMGPYNVAKAGVVALSETLRAEYADQGIGVTAVCPAFFRTNLHTTMRSADDGLAEMASKLVTRAGMSAETIADHIVEAIVHDHPYVVEPAQARLIWVLRRLFPARATAILNAVAERVKRKKARERERRAAEAT